MSNLYSDHADAVLGLLRANAVLADVVYDGRVPDGPPPKYVLVYISPESPQGAGGDNLNDQSITLTTRATLHCVGADAVAARAMAYQARAALLNQRPAVPGWNCTRISLESAPPPTSDETTGVQVMDAICTFRFKSQPA